MYFNLSELILARLGFSFMFIISCMTAFPLVQLLSDSQITEWRLTQSL